MGNITHHKMCRKESISSAPMLLCTGEEKIFNVTIFTPNNKRALLLLSKPYYLSYTKMQTSCFSVILIPLCIFCFMSFLNYF